MPKKIIWTLELDAAIQQKRRQGASWEQVSAYVGVEAQTVIRRARALRIPTGRINIGCISGKDVIAGRRPAAERPRSPRWNELLT